MVGAYIRVSSQMQDENDSVENQMQKAKAFAKKMNEPLELYKEVISGGSGARPEWTRLKKDISKGKLSCAYATKIDRMGRNTEESLSFWTLCKNQNFPFYVNGKKIEWASKTDRLLYVIESAMAENEREEIIERTREAKAIAINDGRKTFRQFFGYDCEVIGASQKNRAIRRWFTVPDEVETIQYIYARYLAGISQHKIAKELNDMGKRSKNGKYFTSAILFHVLHHIEYTGYTVNKAGERIKSKVYTEPIISLADYDEVRRRYPKQSEENTFHKRRPPSHPASGILKCGVCGVGYFFHYQNPPNGHSYYHWLDKTCTQKNRTLSYITVNHIFTDIYMRAMIENPKDLYTRLRSEFLKGKENIDADILRNETLLSEVNTKIKRLITLAESVDDAGITKRLIELRKEKKDIEENLAGLKAGISEEEDKINTIMTAFSQDKIKEYFISDKKRQRDLLAEIIDKAEIDAGTISIRLIDGRAFSYVYKDWKSIARKAINREAQGVKITQENITRKQEVLMIIVKELEGKLIEKNIESNSIKANELKTLINYCLQYLFAPQMEFPDGMTKRIEKMIDDRIGNAKKA